MKKRLLDQFLPCLVEGEDALGYPVRGMEEALLGGLRECPPESPLSLKATNSEWDSMFVLVEPSHAP